MAIGGRGGRKIPNAIVGALLQYLAGDGEIAGAVDTARLHTEGDHTVTSDARWPAATVQYLADVGYAVNRGAVARVDAASIDARTGHLSTAYR
jgi:gamma-glutamyltranspeptidase